MHLQELSGRLVFGAVRVLCHTVSCQGIHGQLIQGPTGRWRPLQTNHRGVFPRCFSRMGAGVWCPPAVAKTWYPGVRGRGREWTDELTPRPPTDLLVFLNVDVDGKDGHSFSHNEWQGTKVERPAVGVSVLLVVVAFIVGVSGIAGDVDDDANYVAQTWWERNTGKSRKRKEGGVEDNRHWSIINDSPSRSDETQKHQPRNVIHQPLITTLSSVSTEVNVSTSLWCVVCGDWTSGPSSVLSSSLWLSHWWSTTCGHRWSIKLPFFIILQKPSQYMIAHGSRGAWLSV